MKEEIDIENLEDVKFTFGKEAFMSKELHCDDCGKITLPEKMEISLPNSFLSVRSCFKNP